MVAGENLKQGNYLALPGSPSQSGNPCGEFKIVGDGPTVRLVIYAAIIAFAAVGETS